MFSPPYSRATTGCRSSRRRYFGPTVRDQVQDRSEAFAIANDLLVNYSPKKLGFYGYIIVMAARCLQRPVAQ
jgi:hypothetical protein